MEANEQRKQGEDNLETLTLDLFDTCWFRRLVLCNHRPPLRRPSPPAPAPAPARDIGEDSESCTLLTSPACLLDRRSNHRRSFSDDLTPTPTHQIGLPKLQTILSGKEATVAGDEIQKLGVTVEGQEQGWMNRRHRRRRRLRRSECSKSMSELEFEELKGLMDLGFTFSDAETDPRLMELVPGLQRLKATATDEGSSASSVDDIAVVRPYLSEAWEAEEEENRLRGLMIPIDSVGDRVDLKDQLRFWAHAVASTVL